MTSIVEYAFMALGAYRDEGDPAALTLDDWSVLEVDPSYDPSDEDFGAVAYQHNLTGEVVIAYRGADQGWLQLGQTALGDEIRSQALDAYVRTPA